jgi:hypothetical protein
MEIYIEGENNFGPKRPIVVGEYKQKRAQFATLLDKDLSEFAIYLECRRDLAPAA